MKCLLFVSSLLCLAPFAIAAKGWIYVDSYPWVWSQEEQTWYWCWSPENSLWMTSVSGRAEKMGEKAAVEWAPASLSSITVRLEATSATYTDDLGVRTVELAAAAFGSGGYSYHQTSDSTFEISYNGIAGYSGTFYFEFLTESSGTWREEYTGPYTGFIAGTFTIEEIAAGG